MRMLLLKTWRDIKARKAQFGALIILISLGISSYIAFVSGYRNLTASNEYAKERLRFADFSISVRSAPKAITGKIRNVHGVKDVQGRLIYDTGIEVGEDNQITSRLIGIPLETQPSVNSLIIDRGGYFSGKGKDQGLLEKHAAVELDLKVGDTLKLIIDGEEHDIYIQGVVSSPEYMYNIRGKGEIPSPGEFAVIFLPQNQAETLLKRPPSYNEFCVLMKPGADRTAAIKEVEDILDPYQAQDTVTQEDQPSNFSIQEEIKQNQSIAYLMPMVILIIASMSLFIALSRLVQSQRGEIGLAKALGYRNWQILLHYLLFSLLIGLGGSLLGFGLGQLFAVGITRLYLQTMALPFLRNEIYPEQIFGSLALSLFTCIVAGLVPAYTSAKLPPATAMRADPNISITKGSTPWIERVISRFVQIPYVIKIPLRNVLRVRRRSLYTITGIAFALLLTIATWASFDSIDFLINKQFNVVENWDMVGVFSQPFSQPRVNTISNWPHVNRVQPALQVPVKMKAHGKTQELALTAMDPKADFHGFDIIEGPDAMQALASGGLIISPYIAKKLDLALGDVVVVSTPLAEDRELAIKVIAVTQEMVGIPAFVGIARGRELIRASGLTYNSIYLDIDQDYAAKIKERLYDMPGAATVVIKKTLVDKLMELMKLSYSMFAILLAFAFTLAFVVVYNTFTANILERLREIATMRTIGEDRWHLAVMITIENLLLALVGFPLGIWLGVWTANYLFRSFSSESFTLTAHIYLESFFWIIGSILIVILLSEIPSIRRVFKLDLAEATKVIE